MYLCRQITMEVLLNLKKNVANVIIQEHSMMRLAIAGCSLCGLWVYSLATKFPQVAQRQPASCKYNPLLLGTGATLKRQTAMRKYVFLALLLATFNSATAQEVTAPEPEFINSYCILTSDATYAQLPKESGTLGKHENKAKKWGKFLGGAASIVGAGGMIGAATAGSATGVINGIRVASAASNVAGVAGTVSGLAGSSGMDVVFQGGESAYTVEGGKDVRLLIKGEKNDVDPKDCYRIVRFNVSKKERRIQWVEFESSLLGSAETKKAGYVDFTGHKYGEQSYLLTIPGSELGKGEYGIFYMSIVTATSIPVGTFSVK